MSGAVTQGSGLGVTAEGTKASEEACLEGQADSVSRLIMGMIGILGLIGIIL